MKIFSAVLIHKKCHSHEWFLASISSVQSLSHVQLFATPWTEAHEVHHQHPELTQIHVHWVGDAIQSSHPLLSPSPPAFSLSQASGAFPMSQFFASSGQSIGASASVSVIPMNIQDWFPFGLTGLISLQLRDSQDSSRGSLVILHFLP